MSLEETQVLEGHDDRVWSVCWSPSGELLASCSGDKTVRMWARQASPSSTASAPKWICKAILEEAHSKTIRSGAWAPNGKLFATASFDGTAAVWEYSGGLFECLATLEGHESEVKSVAWNADSTLLATCSRDKSVWIWEIPSQGGGGVGPSDFECLAVLQGHTQDVKMVRWHPHQNWLVSASYDDTIKVWAAEDPSEADWGCVQTINAAGSSGHTDTVWSLCFDALGNHLVSTSDDLTLKIWDTSCEPGEARPQPGNGAETASAKGWRHLCTVSGQHDRSVFSADWSRTNNLIATGSGDDAIRIFRPNLSAMAMQGGNMGEDPAVELLLTKRQAHSTDVNCVQWHPKDGTVLASAGDDEVVRIWSFQDAP